MQQLKYKTSISAEQKVGRIENGIKAHNRS